MLRPSPLRAVRYAAFMTPSKLVIFLEPHSKKNRTGGAGNPLTRLSFCRVIRLLSVPLTLMIGLGDFVGLVLLRKDHGVVDTTLFRPLLLLPSRGYIMSWLSFQFL